MDKELRLKLLPLDKKIITLLSKFALTISLLIVTQPLHDEVSNVLENIYLITEGLLDSQMVEANESACPEGFTPVTHDPRAMILFYGPNNELMYFSFVGDMITGKELELQEKMLGTYLSDSTWDRKLGEVTFSVKNKKINFAKEEKSTTNRGLVTREGSDSMVVIDTFQDGTMMKQLYLIFRIPNDLHNDETSACMLAFVSE